MLPIHVILYFRSQVQVQQVDTIDVNSTNDKY